MIKPTRKAQAGSNSSDSDDDSDDFVEPKPKSKKPQPKGKAKAKARAKAPNRKGSKDELAHTDDDDSDWEDAVENLTTDPKSVFTSIDLVVSPFSRCTSPEQIAFPHLPG